MIIPNKVYQAIIVGLSDTTDGKYQIYIPTLMSHDSGFKSCMAKNLVSSYGKWINPKTKEVESIGSYIPLQVGMNVNVVFDTEQYDSAGIIGLKFDQIPMNKDDQENFYLFGKTKNGTQIYCDESRNITHIMHNKGVTNAIFFDDKISLSVNETSTAGTNNFSNIEIGKESIILKVGNSSLILDESGLSLATAGNRWEFGSKEINFKTSKFTVEANSFEVVSDKAFINAPEELHLKSNTTRVSGTQHLSLTGNTVVAESNINTTIRSGKGFVDIDAITRLKLSCPASVDVSTLGVLGLSGLTTYLGGNVVAVNGAMVSISGQTIAQDGQILSNMGAATSIGATCQGLVLGLDGSMTGINMALTTAFHLGDVGTGMASNVLAQSIPGIAQAAPNPTPIPSIVPRFDYINTTLKYINTNNKVGNIGTVDVINSLNGNYLPNIYYKA